MQRGFTVIEALIAFSVLAFIVLAVLNGFNGNPEVVCKAGYQFVVVDTDGEVQQLLDSQGKGIPCEAK
jgi:competence protein ComGC